MKERECKIIDGDPHFLCAMCEGWLPKKSFKPFPNKPAGISSGCLKCLKDNAAAQAAYAARRREAEDPGQVVRDQRWVDRLATMGVALPPKPVVIETDERRRRVRGSNCGRRTIRTAMASLSPRKAEGGAE
ncbi:MAG: hypothetical protein QM754_18325 [Tepidisphaeraceae bacterium]